MRRILLLCLLALLAWPMLGHAQSVRAVRVFFFNKYGTTASLSRPAELLSERALARRKRYKIALDSLDIPVSPYYLAQLHNQGYTILNTSRWLNEALVLADSVGEAQLKTLPFVKRTQFAERVQSISRQPVPVFTNPPNAAGRTESFAYGLATHQTKFGNGDKLHDFGYTGRGVQVAVFDAGFIGAGESPAFDSAYAQNRIHAVRDFTGVDPNLFSQDTHGTFCLSTMAANLPNQFVGSAPQADYYLFRTENSQSESPREENNWVAAAEMADSMGIDLISSSLGYTTFDNSALNYRQGDLNGRNAFISQGATMAARKGILVVTSAGNEGASNWRKISFPADADSILSVGADRPDSSLANFSGRGPTADGRIKPDIVLQGNPAYVVGPTGMPLPSNGTSFSCPTAAGFAACLLQAAPQSNPQQIIGIIKQCASQSAKPDTLMGWGIPDYFCSLKQAVPHLPATPNSKPTFVLSPNPTAGSLQLNFFTTQAVSGTLRVIDVLGRQFGQATFAAPPGSFSQIEVPSCATLANGNYFLQIHVNGETYVKRFVKHTP